MKHHSVMARRMGRLVCSIVLTGALAVGATACSGDSSSGGSSPDAKKATTALNAGLKAHSKGDLTTAATDYKRTLTYDSNNKYAFYNLALIDASSGNYGLAEEKYRAALKSDPTYEPALYNLAILRTSRDPKEAIRLYKRAVTANKKDAAAWLNLGLLLRADGNAQEGNKAVLRAIGLNPKLKDPNAPVKRKGTKSSCPASVCGN